MSADVLTKSGSPKNRQQKRKSVLGSPWTPVAFLAPGALYLLLFQGYPLLQELRMSFTDASLLNPSGGKWVGLANYVSIFSSAAFQQTLWTTLIYVIVCVGASISLGLSIALLLNGDFPGRGIARALIAIPWAAPSVAVALIVTWMLNAQYGIVNWFLDLVGLGLSTGAILNSPTYALPAILVTTVWQIFPFSCIVFLAALQGVPKDVVEAAQMDGAGRMWIFRVVTWPVIKPTLALLTLLMTIWSIRRFELIWLMTKGGPVGATRTLVIDLYASGFDAKDLGRAAAIGMVGVIISLLAVIAYQWFARAAERKEG